jgi:hypothetical protein
MDVCPCLARRPSTLEHLAYVLFTAAVLLLLFAASSALGAQGLHPATARAGHRASHHRKAGRRTHRKAGRRTHRKRGAVVRKAATTTAATTLLGDGAVEWGRDSLIAGQAEAFPFPAGTSGAAGVVHVYIDSRNTARTLIVGLYTNLNSHPGLLLTTSSLSSPQAGAWNTAAVAPVQLVSGTTYWLAVLGTGGTLRYRDRWHGPCKAETSAQTNLGALAARWRTGTLYSTCPISAYVTPATTTLPVGPPVEVQPVEPPTLPPLPPLPPPPPPAPTNTVLPAITGSAVEGETLKASTGTWTGGPTSYVYQWQDCNTLGEGCLNVSGATGSSYTLAAGSVGSTVRVVVTASNTGGSTPASSAATAAVIADPPPPPPPTASFTYSPTSPVAGQPVTLDGTSSTCPDGPCTYAWSDDGSTTRPIPPLWPLGSEQTLQYTFSSASTKYVRLVVTDAAGQTATVEHNLVVASELPPPPTSPMNVVAPALSGTAQVGRTLSASNGTWSGSSPMSYAYQWQDCDSSGASCVSVGGATASSYMLGSGDVGHTVRVMVTATNSGGVGVASSEHTAVVTVEGEVKPDCFAEPHTCGYPDKTNTGVPEGTSLEKVGPQVVTVEGTVISKKEVEGTIEVEASNVTIEDTEVVNDEPGCVNEGACGGSGIVIREGATGTVITHDTIHGIGDENELTIESCIHNEGGESTAVTYSYGYYCLEFGRGVGKWESNYSVTNATRGVLNPFHYDTFFDGGEGPVEKLVLKHNTFFNPKNHTSVILLQEQAGNIKEVVIEDNFLGGGGFMIYGGGGGHSGGTAFTANSESGSATLANVSSFASVGAGSELKATGIPAGTFVVSTNTGAKTLVMTAKATATTTGLTITPSLYRTEGPIIVEGNRFARCLGKEVEGEGGAHLCEGLAEESNDGHGYYPLGGSFGEFVHFNEAVTSFSGNYWDDNLEAVVTGY